MNQIQARGVELIEEACEKGWKEYSMLQEKMEKLLKDCEEMAKKKYTEIK